MDRVISKLAEVDPTFVQVVKSLYGDAVDPRELWDLTKGMPDQSAIAAPGATQPKKSKQTKNPLQNYAKPVVPNVPSTIPKLTPVTKFSGGKKPEDPKKERKLAAIGLAATGLAGVGALHGLKGTRDEVQEGFAAADKGKYAGKVSGKVGRAFKLTPKKTAVLAAGGWAGLHGAELVADSLAARAQMKTLRETKKTKKQDIGKGDITGVKTVARLNRAMLSANEQKRIADNAALARKNMKRVAGTAVAGAGAGGYFAGRKIQRKFGDKTAVAVLKPQKAKVQKSNEYEWTGEISKVDTDKRLVFGWCSLSKVNGEPVVDLQGDYIPIEETETAAYKYVIESRKGGDMHRRVSKFDTDEPLHTADIVESMVFTPEKLEKLGLARDAIPHGWWIGMKVNDDEQWAEVKKGNRLGFSVHGKGRRMEKSL